MALGAVAIGLTEFVPSGLLPQIAQDVLRDEYASRPAVWLIAATGAIGFSGFFAATSYIAPMTTSVAGLPASAVAWVLVAVGLGMTAGNAVGGWYSDRHPQRAMLLGFASMTLATAFVALAATQPVGLFIGAFLVGATTLFLAPALQARLIAAAPGAQLMGAALNQSATNVANSLGAAVGSVVIGAGLGLRAPATAGVVFGLLGLALAIVGAVLSRRHVARDTVPAAVN